MNHGNSLVLTSSKSKETAFLWRFLVTAAFTVTCCSIFLALRETKGTILRFPFLINTAFSTFYSYYYGTRGRVAWRSLIFPGIKIHIGQIIGSSIQSFFEISGSEPLWFFLQVGITFLKFWTIFKRVNWWVNMNFSYPFNSIWIWLFEHLSQLFK